MDGAKKTAGTEMTGKDFSCLRSSIWRLLPRAVLERRQDKGNNYQWMLLQDSFVKQQPVM